uniref:Uncharacterized protein n=1 Tax=Caenorhabditis japonica TaxID=281687 RepID=A0A8R1E8I6_CAEJA
MPNLMFCGRWSMNIVLDQSPTVLDCGRGSEAMDAEKIILDGPPLMESLAAAKQSTSRQSRSKTRRDDARGKRAVRMVFQPLNTLQGPSTAGQDVLSRSRSRRSRQSIACSFTHRSTRESHCIISSPILSSLILSSFNHSSLNHYSPFHKCSIRLLPRRLHQQVPAVAPHGKSARRRPSASGRLQPSPPVPIDPSNLGAAANRQTSIREVSILEFRSSVQHSRFGPPS